MKSDKMAVKWFGRRRRRVLGQPVKQQTVEAWFPPAGGVVQ